ncbi:TnsA endonuclease N-terminal domain-containing protein [uncultured Tateyamaria sp.]|uniref:TnsA endonuclease N-terminal domain-containing protein n=1 Tax=uncultured Tateyamaria sp. TaxID=455651 RepID=UPI002610E146|nr:TnsA endonuclease N-terminal domain-containing protein [uncultured Tateyamaria sp.]
MTTVIEDTEPTRPTGPIFELSTGSVPIQLPQKLRGSRKIRSRSAISARGIIVARIRGAKRLMRIGYESSLERSFALMALAEAETVDIVEQPFTLRYIDADGRTRRYTFDYLVTKRDGRRIAIEVKTSQQAKKPKVIAQISDAASRLVPDYADEVFLFTERNFTRTQVENAEQFVNCQREIDPDADDQLAEVISTLKGSMTVSDLVKVSGLAERGYPAIVRAMYSNLLHWRRQALIGPKTLVSREVVQ